MSEVTRILSAVEQGDPHAAGRLLPLVYDELRKLAAQRMAQEKPGQTLQATALVHEAYLRLVEDQGVGPSVSTLGPYNRSMSHHCLPTTNACSGAISSWSRSISRPSKPSPPGSAPCPGPPRPSPAPRPPGGSTPTRASRSRNWPNP